MTSMPLRQRYIALFGNRPRFLGARQWDRKFRTWASGYLAGRMDRVDRAAQ